MHVAVLLAALLGAAAPPPSGAPLVTSPPTDSAKATPPEAAPVSQEHPPLKLLGVQLSAGAPEGLGVGAFVRPLPWVRVDAGVAYNALSFGIQGGVTVIPWTGSVTPTFRLGLGQYFESDVTDELGDALPAALDPALENFGYHFYTAQVGLELGNANGTQFFVRGGLAWVRSDLDSTTVRDGDTTVTVDRSELSATAPTLQLGVLFHLW